MDMHICISLPTDNKTKLHFRALDEAIDVDSEAYCWRRNGFFWRMRASLGLACAQATTLCSQVFGKVYTKPTRGPEPGAHVLEPLHLTSDLCAPPRMSLSIQ